MGSFGRETNRILHGQWQIKVCRLHIHAGTHILSLETTNYLFWKMFVVFWVFFYFFISCHSVIKAWKLCCHIYSIPVVNMETSLCRGQLSSMNVEHIQCLIPLVASTWLADSRPRFQSSRQYITKNAVIFQVVLPIIKLHSWLGWLVGWWVCFAFSPKTDWKRSEAFNSRFQP